ncbi:hypothetical protein HDU76_009799 [Blyttiomyces sp. JEL0837]|nr:hypothetical protein HDU76_009799 [Blyttiomyces sp. JEL0837]
MSRNGTSKLFDRVILQSAGYPTMRDIQSISTQSNYTNMVSKAVGCPVDPSSMDCLRKADANAIVNAAGGIDWKPVVDGVFLVDMPVNRVLNALFTKVPMMAGTTTNEGSLFAQGVAADADFRPFIKSNFPWLTDNDLNTVEGLYPANLFQSPLLRAAEAYGDAVFVCPNEELALQVTQSSTSFRYRWNHGIPSPYFAYHSMPTSYIFTYNGNNSTPSTSPQDLTLSDSMITWITSFVHTGNPSQGPLSAAPAPPPALAPLPAPSPSTNPPQPSLAVDMVLADAKRPPKPPKPEKLLKWPSYRPESRLQMVIGGSGLNIETDGAYMSGHEGRCVFWRQVDVVGAGANGGTKVVEVGSAPGGKSSGAGFLERGWGMVVACVVGTLMRLFILC